MFQPGNEFWRQRSRHGANPKFEHGEKGAAKLREAIEDYFEWMSENPIQEQKLFAYEGAVYKGSADKLAPLTIGSMCLFIGISTHTWELWRKERKDLFSVITWADETIRAQKFAGAAAGLLNANIISRDLGLADKREVSGPGGGPVQTINTEMSAEEAADLYAQTREQE